MEYASGGELFERICNAGRFNEDEVFPLELLFPPCQHYYFYNIHLHLLDCRLASFFNNWFQELAIVMLWYTLPYFVSAFLIFFKKSQIK